MTLVLRSARYPRQSAGMTEFFGVGVAESWRGCDGEVVGCDDGAVLGEIPRQGAGMTESFGAGVAESWGGCDGILGRVWRGGGGM